MLNRLSTTAISYTIGKVFVITRESVLSVSNLARCIQNHIKKLILLYIINWSIHIFHFQILGAVVTYAIVMFQFPSEPGVDNHLGFSNVTLAP